MTERAKKLLIALLVILAIYIVMPSYMKGSTNLFHKYTAAEYNTLGYQADKAGSKLKARRYFKKGLKVAKVRPTDKLIVARLEYNLGTTYSFYDKQAKARAQYEKAVKLYEESFKENPQDYSSNDYRIYVDAYYMYAKTETDINKKLSTWEKAYEIASNGNIESTKCRIQIAIADYYLTEKKDYAKAEQYLTNQLKNDKLANQERQSVYTQRARLYAKIGKLDKAKQDVKTAIALGEKGIDKYSQNLAKAYGLYSYLLLKEGKCKEAETYYVKYQTEDARASSYKYPILQNKYITKCKTDVSLEEFSR